jgi:3-oxoacyl-[acyl-carrier protein] reductase
MSRFERIQIGDRAELTHRVTAEDLHRFVELSGDHNRLHLDADYAARTPLKAPVVHGMLGVSFISAVIGNRLPGDGALWFAQSLEFLLPVRVGDTLTVCVEVTSKLDRENVIELTTDILNQYKQKVTTGVAKIKVMEEAQPSQSVTPVQIRAALVVGPTGVTKVKEDVQPNKPVSRVPPKTALVVGATGGIGRAVCAQLAADGFDLALHSHRDHELGDALQRSLAAYMRQMHVVQADITDDGQVRDLIETTDRLLGGIGVVVNCASARIASQPFGVLDWTDLEVHLAVSVHGAFNLARHVVPVMERQGGGRIIQITSQAVDTPNGNWLPYVTAKAALGGFSRALAVELAPKGIRVNLVSPGMTDTELIGDIPEKTRLLIAARTPLKRLARPEDVAGAVAFLASDRADFLTGETIRVNGGQVML